MKFNITPSIVRRRIAVLITALGISTVALAGSMASTAGAFGGPPPSEPPTMVPVGPYGGTPAEPPTMVGVAADVSITGVGSGQVDVENVGLSATGDFTVALLSGSGSVEREWSVASLAPGESYAIADESIQPTPWSCESVVADFFQQTGDPTPEDNAASLNNGGGCVR